MNHSHIFFCQLSLKVSLLFINFVLRAKYLMNGNLQSVPIHRGSDFRLLKKSLLCYQRFGYSFKRMLQNTFPKDAQNQHNVLKPLLGLSITARGMLITM